MDTEDLSFTIRGRDAKVRKSWGKISPATKVEKLKKHKREKDNVRRLIEEGFNDLNESDS